MLELGASLPRHASLQELETSSKSGNLFQPYIRDVSHAELFNSIKRRRSRSKCDVTMPKRF